MINFGADHPYPILLPVLCMKLPRLPLHFYASYGYFSSLLSHFRGCARTTFERTRRTTGAPLIFRLKLQRQIVPSVLKSKKPVPEFSFHRPVVPTSDEPAQV